MLTTSDYDNDSETLVKIGEEQGGLGNYYSEANAREKLQDVTDHPYAKVIYSKLIPGTVLKSIGGNKKDNEWKNGYSFTMRAGQELSRAEAFDDPKYADQNYKIYKTIMRDVRGVENVVFKDAEGKVLAAARSGEGPTKSTYVNIREQGFVDVHIPQNRTGLTITNTSGQIIKVYDLITEQQIYTAYSALPSGFYRVAISNLATYFSNNPVRVTYPENYYDYSLNAYDKAGRLIKSYQPLGKQLVSSFDYNSLGQLQHTASPDEGEAWFKYRRDGQIRFSQNSVQKVGNRFSYTNYDTKGRPVESGVVASSGFATADPDGGAPAGTKTETQTTIYDKLPPADLTFLNGVNGSYAKPTFLAGNVAKTSNANSTSYYSYDIYGRVQWMVQKIVGLGNKAIDYTYDPITSEVLQVDYQKFVPGEQFVHRYTYDIVGQLTKVETGASPTTLAIQAEYDYYETGALKRTEIANGLQGMDYVYTLEGQLKSINHPDLTAAKDPGGDANDLFGMAIHYNSEDYSRQSTPKPIASSTLGTDQYNGNIKGIEWKTQGVEKSNYYYDYDRNNWLKKADFNIGAGGSGSNPANIILNAPTTGEKVASNSITLKPGFVAASGTSFTARIAPESGGTDYDVDNLAYDANGNILSLRRNKHTENGNNAMDDLTYSYTPNTNQLAHVDDAVTAATNADDIKDQAAGNYEYNAIGQLVRNVQDGTTYTYNASGLVTAVIGANQSVSFFYDDKGKRVKKLDVNGGQATATYYVRDAAGSVLGIYSNNTLEHPVYGASRIGVVKRTGLAQTTIADEQYLYELTDHLGNVRAVVQKSGSQALAIVKTDYYPFGSPMPDRNVEGNYRYAYQGQEKDAETGMEAFEARLWDSRIGRWLTIDPAGEFFSPYLGMANNPVSVIDPDGRCTECPNNAGVGDIYMHSEYGEVTFGENGWSTADGVAILNDVVIGGNQMTPFDVGVEWLTGTEPRQRNFGPGDTFTEMIKTHDHVKETSAIIGRKLANDDELYGFHRYQLSGIEGVGKYVKDYSTLLTAGQTGNLAVTYLGSYKLDYSLSDLDMERRTVRIHYTVHNNSTIQSALRPPVIGYKDWWQNSVDKFWERNVTSGPLSPTSQAIRWSETIKF